MFLILIMGRIGKALALFLTSIVVLSSITLFTNAQIILKPSVPEFTLKLVHHSYEQPTIYQIDPYTGENVTSVPAKHSEWDSIVVNIENQPFTPYKDSNGNQIELFYNVRSKGHSSEIWVERHNAEEGFPKPLDSAYRTVDYTVDLPVNAQVDFQVQAFIGYNTRITDAWTPFGEEYHYVFNGESSGWSNTQTISIADSSVSSSTPDPSPTVPELSWWAIVPLLLAVFAVVLVIRYRKIAHG